jgi:hypothetical protein
MDSCWCFKQLKLEIIINTNGHEEKTSFNNVSYTDLSG